MKEPNRTDLLNFLATRYNLKRFLEIGTQNPIQNFDKIICEYKVSVDPDPNAHATFCMTSDEYFVLVNDEKSPYDLIFIDGLHTAEQVQKDFENALKILSPNGFIVLHDCNPEKEEYTHVPRDKKGSWNGDVYKFAIGVDKAAAYTVNIDNGCLIFDNSENKNATVYKPVETGWDFFDANRKTLLNLVTWEGFIKNHETRI